MGGKNEPIINHEKHDLAKPAILNKEAGCVGPMFKLR
jgi:hypothetical protein